MDVGLSEKRHFLIILTVYTYIYKQMTSFLNDLTHPIIVGGKHRLPISFIFQLVHFRIIRLVERDIKTFADKHT